ncbi:50S ribosomal protein L11 methyltransferase [Nitrosomonas sp.]|uniref:50S ribosomal protein L11 methyltransferase n=1 Tax=Nitrosomonas sp. TaxID=42353 RepID=UPI0025E8DC48|nr:50S ribosomal protein L11 methyltransferase [Nitrosomonas sp.]MCC6916052.1 50S ribosomal protein L11 methyltransferase [Nitrosomonas sp.]
MPWLSLTFRIESDHVDWVSDRLLEQGALSVDVHDAGEGTSREQPLFGEPDSPPDQFWQLAEVTVLLEENTNTDEFIRKVAEITGLAELPEYQLAQVMEQDWVRLTQSQFEPIEISSRLWIVPSWHAPPDSSAINLRLDPGLAFGTGSHPTTRLCLTWLDKFLQPGDSVLDYGCGSGILAIAALKLGADRVTGVDIDPNAITASLSNAGNNDCDLGRLRFTTSLSSLENGRSGNAAVTLVVANILANPLIMLAPVLMQALQPGGHVVLSGILESQADEVLRVYSQWCDMRVAEKELDWVLLSGRKKRSGF